MHSKLKPFMSRLFIALFACLLAAQPLVAAAQTPNDRRYNEQWHLEQIDAPLAWDTETGSADVVVAVLDTGVDLDHPDLIDNIWENPGEVADNGRDDDGNGFVDDVHGWDFIDDDALPTPDPTGSSAAVAHGTLISGLIAAEGNNREGVAGVAWRASIMAVRMLNAEGSGDSSTAARAIDYAVENGADVINLSFAGIASDTVFNRAIERAYEAGVVVVAAMGNEAQDTDSQAVYPACLQDDDADWVLGVASSDVADAASSFSNYGRDCTDISAPGENMYGPTYYDGETFTDKYAGGWSGTSMAAPVVSGAVALLKSAFPSLSVDEVHNALLLSVDPLRLRASQRGKYGSGRLNVANALVVAAQYAALHADEDEDASDTSREADTIGGVTAPRQTDAQLALGATSGGQPVVDLRTADGTSILQFVAYSSAFTGGIRVAEGDVDGDGDVDVVTGAGSGGGPHVRAFTSQGALLGEFFPYAASSRAGVELAVGDVDGDGTDDIVTAVGAGVSQDVVVWNKRGEEQLRFTASVFAATDALRVAVGDIDGDGKGEIVVASGKGSAPKVAVYDHNGTYLLEFAPYATSFTGGVFVAAGDVNGDGVDEIITGTGDGGGPHVRVFNRIGAVLYSFFAFAETTRHGVRVASADTDGDGTDEIVAAPGPGMSELRILSANGDVQASWDVSVTGGEGTAVAAW